MDTDEQEINAHQHKDRTDLNMRQTNVWAKFLRRREEYAQKYGSEVIADRLLRKEKEALETGFAKDHQELTEQHDQQWLDYFNDSGPVETPSQSLSVSREAEPALNPIEVNAKSAQSPTDPSARTLFSNPFKQPEQAQKQAITNETKGLDQSQDYMNAMLSAQKAKPAREMEAEVGKKSVSMSARFSQGLSYTRAESGSGNLTGKSPRREFNRERD